MKWLVTGGAGFVGANLVSELCRRGEQLLVVDKDSVAWTERDGKYYVRKDFRLAEERTVDEVYLWSDVVVHLAALSGIAQCSNHPWESFAVNVSTTHALLEQCAKARKRFIFASSGAVVAGEGDNARLSSSQPICPANVYGAQKAAAEALCMGYRQERGVEAVALRFSNVYGPHSEHKRSVIHAFLQDALAGKPIQIHGSGKQCRDFIFVGDLVDAIIRAGQVEGIDAPVLHVSSGEVVPVYDPTAARDVFRLVERESGQACLCEHVNNHPGVSYSCLDNESAKMALDWEPRTSIEDGILATTNWYRATK